MKRRQPVRTTILAGNPASGGQAARTCTGTGTQPGGSPPGHADRPGLSALRLSSGRGSWCAADSGSKFPETVNIDKAGWCWRSGPGPGITAAITAPF